MGKKKKNFTTKKNIKWKFIDIIVFSVIFIINIRGFIINSDAWVEQFRNYNILALLIAIFSIILSSFPYVIIYWGLRYTIRRYNKSVVTFNVEYDLEYYRDKFNGMSPATMSLLMDLNLESDKDLGAMKLYYELYDVYMYIRDGQVGINNPHEIKINKSDEILLKYFFDNKNKIESLIEWKENVICENINNNLIERKKNNDKKKVGCGIFILIHILAFAYIIYYCTDIKVYSEILDTIVNSAQTDFDVYNMLINNSDYMHCFIMSLILVVALSVYFWSIIGGIIHLIVSNAVAVKDKLKRTKEGNILADKLYGMKNFIRDFSNLDEASRKHLVLWEDFLIYAVVLEENDTILNEISKMYHTDLLKYKHYKN